MKIVIFPYKMGSESAKALAKELGVLRVFSNRDFKPTPDTVVVNWGNGYTPHWNGDNFTFLNRPEQVCNAINKITAMYKFQAAGVAIPDFTQFQTRAAAWIKNYGAWMCARTSIEGLDGEGLILTKPGDVLPLAPLYTRYVPIEHEYRVYVFDGKVIDSLEKTPKTGADKYIRTEKNGWEFQKCDHNKLDSKITTNSIKAVQSLGLLFGGVDIIRGDDGSTRVFEVNTAPYILGRSVRRFAEAIKEYVSNLQ